MASLEFSEFHLCVLLYPTLSSGEKTCKVFFTQSEDSVAFERKSKTLDPEKEIDFVSLNIRATWFYLCLSVDASL